MLAGKLKKGKKAKNLKPVISPSHDNFYDPTGKVENVLLSISRSPEVRRRSMFIGVCLFATTNNIIMNIICGCG